MRESLSVEFNAKMKIKEFSPMVYLLSYNWNYLLFSSAKLADETRTRDRDGSWDSQTGLAISLIKLGFKSEPKVNCLLGDTDWFVSLDDDWGAHQDFGIPWFEEVSSFWPFFDVNVDDIVALSTVAAVAAEIASCVLKMFKSNWPSLYALNNLKLS